MFDTINIVLFVVYFFFDLHSFNVYFTLRPSVRKKPLIFLKVFWLKMYKPSYCHDQRSQFLLYTYIPMLVSLIVFLVVSIY